jgi:hypothetical protein
MSAYQDINAISALGCSEVKLRSASGECFPGQYFDEETNLHYNHFKTNKATHTFSGSRPSRILCHPDEAIAHNSLSEKPHWFFLLS